MGDDIKDVVAPCIDPMPHGPHQWFARDAFPTGYRCYGVTEEDYAREQTNRLKPPGFETKG